MHNVDIKASGSRLVITVDTSPKQVQAAPLSSTRKTRLLGTTGGAVPVECKVPGLKVALNVMLPPE